MALAHIKLSATQYFNFMCRTDFERRIYHDTYREFQKKSKIYSSNQQFTTFEQMRLANQKANSLHQKLFFIVSNTINNLQNKMPLLADTSKNALHFESASLEICSSDLLNKAGHVVAITYTSPTLVLNEIVDDHLILSYDVPGAFNHTFMVKITENLVISYQENKAMAYN